MLGALFASSPSGEGATTEHNPLVPEVADLVWSTLCFVIIAIVFAKVILPRMRIMLDARSAAIEGNIEKADESYRKAEAALESYTTQLAGARTEAASIRDAARDDAKRIIVEAKNQATIEAERVTHAAQTQIAAERQAAVVSLRTEVGSLAIDLASGVIGENLSDSEKSSAVIDRLLSELAEDEKRVSLSRNS